jgi:hypothetical protein
VGIGDQGIGNKEKKKINPGVLTGTQGMARGHLHVTDLADGGLDEFGFLFLLFLVLAVGFGVGFLPVM